MAAIKGKSMKHIKCADALLRKGANANAKSSLTGRSALSLAIEHQYFDGYKLLVLTLLLHGANPNLKDKNGDTPLLQILYGGYEALAEHRRDALALIFQNTHHAIDVNITPPGTLNTPLHLAVRRKDPYATGMLLKKGANITARNGAGQTALALAVSSWSPRMTEDQKELARILLKAGADVDERLGPRQSPALHTSIVHGLLDMVQMLIKWRADPYVTNKNGQDAFAICTDALAQGRLTQQLAEDIMAWLTISGTTGESVDESDSEPETASLSSSVNVGIVSQADNKKLQHGVRTNVLNRIRGVYSL